MSCVDVELYKSECQEMLRRFLAHQLSYEQCVAALDAAISDVAPRLTSEQPASLREFTTGNRDIIDRAVGSPRTD
jgi:hypothetical protein